MPRTRGAKPRSIQVAPFPPLVWDGCCWSGEDNLPSWAGFQARLGSYGAVSSTKPSRGRVRLSVGGERATESLVPSPAMATAYSFLKADEPQVGRAVLLGIFKAYTKLQRRYGYEGADAELLMPNLKRAEDLRALIGLNTVHFLSTARDGIGCIGFEFGCMWDEEHGLGVMTHKLRVLEVSDADASFLEWIAERGLRKR